MTRLPRRGPRRHLPAHLCCDGLRGVRVGLWALGADAVAGGCDLASRVLYGAPVELIHFKAANLEGHEHDDHRHYARRNGYHSDRR